MTALFAFLTLCLTSLACAEKIPEALDADDQCVDVSGGCAVNALQLHAKGIEIPDIPELPEQPELLSLDETEKWHSDYYGHKPRADISVSNYKSLMANISVQQKAIMALWNRSVKLGEEVQALVQQVQHDSGLKVQDYVVLVEDAVDVSSRKQREESQPNQPREALVKKWIRYLPKIYILVLEFFLASCLQLDVT